MARVKHIALFKFKDGTPQEQIDKAFEELMDVSENVPGIEDYVSGPNNSPQNLNQGFTHGFVMTFESPEARNAYLPHPEHERVNGTLSTLVDNMLVFDFEL